MSWLTFLNFSLMAGAAAASIPLLLYLWRRQRRVTVAWGAMHLLEQALRAGGWTVCCALHSAPG